MALLKARNKDLISNERERTYLTKDGAVSDTTITVEQINADSNEWANGDYLIIGEIGAEKSEIRNINAAVSTGTSITITGLQFSHPAGTPVYRVDFNQVEFSRATTATGSKTVLATVNIQPDDLFTRYNDTSNTSGYAFFRFYNSSSSAYSTYSAAIPYTGYPDLSLHKIRERVRRYILDKDGRPVVFFEDEEIDDAINDAQRDISQEFRWSFFEKVSSLSAVANQREYSLASDYWGRLYDITYDTQPLVVIDEKNYNILHWDVNTTGNPTHCFIRNKKLLLWPTRTTAAATTTLSTTITATDTSMTVASTSSFPSKGRIIIDSEVISYDAKTSTTLTGLTRGLEDTDAAAHTDTTTLTNRDFIYTYYAKPTNLSDETDETVIEDADLVAIDAALILMFTRAPEDKGIIDRLQTRRDRKIILLKDAFGDKYAGNMGRVKRKWEVNRTGKYWPALHNPQDLTGV